MLPCHLEPAAQIVPDGDARLVAGPGKTEESIAAVTSDAAACHGTELPPRDVTPDIVLGSVGVERDLRLFEHYQQLGSVADFRGGRAIPDDRRTCWRSGIPGRSPSGSIPADRMAARSARCSLGPGVPHRFDANRRHRRSAPRRRPVRSGCILLTKAFIGATNLEVALLTMAI